MKRILIHAGFHKTGTTSVQQTLLHNTRTLRRNFQIFTRKNMTGACEAARSYSASRNMADLLVFTAEMTGVFEQVDVQDTRPVIISSEDLSGYMPGRRGLSTYSAAPILMKAITETANRVFNSQPELIFYFSTREPQSWLRSCYAQHVRVIRITQTLEEYQKEQAASADLGRIIDGVRLAVAPHRVVASSLEDNAPRPLGPLAAVFDALSVPSKIRRRLSVLPPANVSLPQELLNEFLAANQSDLDDATVAKAKTEARRIWLTGTADA
ncbi:MAG: hypothetical protein ABJG73_15005 [Tateyamaria sp.]|uniref:hypothetical protein n=1 Tax=Roseobacteraceae TaxID=2854170 RepID=UPI0032976C8A